ncbi:MAG: hypothetical protein MJE77_14910 [Proteobacteria bacterium]|nr:hypothetical protein [Pseudomonadota bacterium]
MEKHLAKFGLVGEPMNHELILGISLDVDATPRRHDHASIGWLPAVISTLFPPLFLHVLLWPPWLLHDLRAN